MPLPEQVDAWAEAQMASYGIPGMVIGVYRDGVAEYVRALGFADLEQRVPMSRESVCEICSITKQFTAASILLLQEGGELCLSDPVVRYVPHMPERWHDVTLLELLNHTSGINDDKFDLADEELTEEVLARAATTVARGRGEAWEYSNLAYRLLGDVVAKLSGLSFFDFLRDRILDPLGLSSTFPNDTRVIPNRVRGYGSSGDVLFNAPMLSGRAGGGAGGLVSTIDDLSRWSFALMCDDLLSPESRALMLQPGRLNGGDIARPPYCAGGYGLGVNVNTIAGHRLEKHAGGWYDASAQLTRLIDDRLTVAILTNFGAWAMRPWAGEALASMFVPGFRLPKLAPAPDPDPTRLAVLGAVLNELAGSALSTEHVSPRLHAQLSSDAAGWSQALNARALSSTEFVEQVPQGARELMIYRQEGDPPNIVCAGFANDGRLDSIVIGPVPE